MGIRPIRTPLRIGMSGSQGKINELIADDAEEAFHRCQMQERALERINTNFQHLVTLVELAVVGDESSGKTANGTSSGGRTNFAGLLKRLRAVIAASQNDS